MKNWRKRGKCERIMKKNKREGRKLQNGRLRNVRKRKVNKKKKSTESKNPGISGGRKNINLNRDLGGGGGGV